VFLRRYGLRQFASSTVLGTCVLCGCAADPSGFDRYDEGDFARMSCVELARETRNVARQSRRRAEYLIEGGRHQSREAVKQRLQALKAAAKAKNC